MASPLWRDTLPPRSCLVDATLFDIRVGPAECPYASLHFPVEPIRHWHFLHLTARWIVANSVPSGKTTSNAPGVRAGRARAGFSLLELVVVVAIIAVLLGIILPVLSGARRAARSTQCLQT